MGCTDLHLHSEPVRLEEWRDPVTTRPRRTPRASSVISATGSDSQPPRNQRYSPTAHPPG
jgi:hypothetical protein